MVLQIRDINLTPDHPAYDGEEWHVQGQSVSQLSSKFPSPRSQTCTSHNSFALGVERAHLRNSHIHLFHIKHLHQSSRPNALLPPPHLPRGSHRRQRRNPQPTIPPRNLRCETRRSDHSKPRPSDLTREPNRRLAECFPNKTQCVPATGKDQGGTPPILDPASDRS